MAESTKKRAETTAMQENELQNPQEVKDEELKEFDTIIERCKQLQQLSRRQHRKENEQGKKRKQNSTKDDKVDEFYEILHRIKKEAMSIRSSKVDKKEQKIGVQVDKGNKRAGKEWRWKPVFDKEDFNDGEFDGKKSVVSTLGEVSRRELFDLNDMPVGADFVTDKL